MGELQRLPSDRGFRPDTDIMLRRARIYAIRSSFPRLLEFTNPRKIRIGYSSWCVFAIQSLRTACTTIRQQFETSNGKLTLTASGSPFTNLCVSSRILRSRL